jgi:hypothetical protein
MTVMQFSMCGGGGRSPCRKKNVQWSFRDPPVLYQGFARTALVLKRTVTELPFNEKIRHTATR